MERPVSFFAMLIILLFAVIGFIFIIFELKGIAFVFELGLLLAFMFSLAFAMFLVYNDRSASWPIMALVLILLLLDVFIIFLLTGAFGWEYVITTLSAVAGLAVVLANIFAAPRKEPTAETHYDKKQYYYPLSEKAEEKEEMKEEIKNKVKSELKKEQKVSAKFTPGKYVASKKAGTFHAAKCDWASRISKENMVWFDSKEEALARGLNPDKCVQ